jgi:hypothetical protein
MRTLALGTKVRLVSVDKYGFVGREQHPTQADIGFEGIIMDIAHDSDQDCNDIPDYTYYLVEGKDKSLECMDFEVEEVKEEQEPTCFLPAPDARECQALYVLLTKDAALAEQYGDDLTATIQSARAELAATYRAKAEDADAST